MRLILIHWYPRTIYDYTQLPVKSSATLIIYHHQLYPNMQKSVLLTKLCAEAVNRPMYSDFVNAEN